MAYDEDIAGAYESISAAGAPMVLRKGALGNYDAPNDVWSAPSGTAQTDGVAVKVPPGSIEFRNADSVEGRETTEFIVAALGLTFAPEPGMVIEFAGDAWSVDIVEPIDPDGTPIIFQVRGVK